MPTKVISIRMSAKELADIYNYLTIACGVDTKNMPVSNVITVSLSHMIKWVRTAMELPVYETEESALEFLKSTLTKVPTCFTPDTQMPKFEIPHVVHTLNIKKIEKGIHTELAIPDPLLNPHANRAEERELAAQRKDKVIDLIEQFTEKKDAQEIDELVDNITKKDLYKKEEDAK